MNTLNCTLNAFKSDFIERKLTWNELKVVVNDLRRELAAVSSTVPNEVSFKELNESIVRVYYLVNTPDWGIPLLYIDVPLNATTFNTISSSPRLSGRPGMDCLPESGVQCSREQRLLSERQRQPSWGAITSYHLHPQHNTILFPVQGSLYLLKQMEGWCVPQVVSTGGSAALTPAMCPHRSDMIAYTTKGDIWLAGGCGTPVRLTYACRGNSRLADDPKQAGVPCYVMQEEFSRYTGFWWQPQTKNAENVYRILYEEVDESNVKIYSFPSYNSADGDIEEFRFPRAGSPNARTVLRLIEFTIEDNRNSPMPEHKEKNTSCSNEHEPWDMENDMAGDETESQWKVTSIRWFDLQRPLEEAFPWMEYIARIGWGPTPEYVWCQILDRRQQRLELVLIPVENFAEPYEYEMAPSNLKISAHQNCDNRIWTPMQVLLSEKSPDGWMNVQDILVFLPSRDPNRTHFIWASEESGHLHLYLITATISGKDGIISPTYATSSILSKVPLTSGKWEVIGKKIWVNASRGLVYFVGLKDSPLEKHLYCVSFHEPHPETPHRLTEAGYSYNIDIDHKCSVVVGTHSNIHNQPLCVVYLIHHSPNGPTLCPVGTVAISGPCSTEQPWSYDTAHIYRPPVSIRPARKDKSPYTIELHSMHISTGEELHAMMFRPTMEPQTPRPTLLYVYGGPVVQTVTNTYKGIRLLRMHMVAARGYCVVCIDSRGSKHRGVEFEARIRGRMGTVELEDQIEVLKHLAEETGCIDLNRVAVHGWSYGGYLSLMALAQRPDLFKLCIACAPVTSWEMYDTAYTERYMDLPHLNPTGYAKGSVVKLADKFPDQENRLLIVHGLQDENVHFLHTQKLIDALVTAGKPYQLQVYPNERHSLRYLEASTHYEATLLSFLQNNL